MFSSQVFGVHTKTQRSELGKAREESPKEFTKRK